MPERRLIMCEVRYPDGTVEAEPLIVDNGSFGWWRIELPDGTVWRAPVEAFRSQRPSLRYPSMGRDPKERAA